MSRNAEVARLYEEYADLLEAAGDEYRPRSYRRAAQNIADYPEAIEDLAAEGPEALQRIEGVGEAIAEKTIEYVETGSVEAIEEAREALPVAMRELTGVEGVGPKTVGDLYEQLGIRTLDDLEAAARAGRIRELSGYGERTEANILENLAFARQATERALLGEAQPIATSLLDHLAGADAVDRCEAAGSLRRWRETIGDIDVLAAGTDPAGIVERFLDWEVDETIEAGTAKASVRARGFRIDLRVVDPEEWGAALQYFTGSKDHNVRLRQWAIDRGYKVNEYGVFDVSEVDRPDDGPRAGERIAGETEAGVYASLGLEWLPPELREDRGEVDAAAAGTLPDLVETPDVRGDLHVHTDWSDGDESIEGMVAAADSAGLEYVCISDHAVGPGVIGGMGLDESAVRAQTEAIREVAAGAPIEVLAGIEVNIDGDGGLSLGADVLADLDLVVASPHSGLRGDGTDRLVEAVGHSAVDVLGHPSGRLLGQRPGLEFDAESVASAAAAHGTALEVNANPRRLDLRGEAVRAAIEAGAAIAINTDAHSRGEFGHLEFGVRTARRGWAEAGDVVNARPIEELRAFFA